MGRDNVFITTVVPFLQPQFIGKAENVYYEGEHADEIYFIRKGRVGYTVHDMIFKVLNVGTYFGDLE